MRRVAALCCVLGAVGCADRDVLYHHVGADEDGAAQPVPRDGNFPEPAMSVCGPLPKRVDPIGGLASAWGVSGPVPGLTEEGETYPQDAIRLRFSDIGFDCTEAFVAPEGAEGEPLVSGWAFAISLQTALHKPGVYVLDDAPGLYLETMTWVAHAGEEVGGGGADYEPASDEPAELEILEITDTCIIGEFRNFTVGVSDVDPNGGFVAQRCKAACVPQFGVDCG